ncbi:MAG: GAF domain-containing protein [Actinomycetota bacterium]|nr:GAF domain-containing protein [Actinomycetota bacterium]
MSQSNQALWFNAVPLLVVAAAYVGATASLAPVLRRSGPRSQFEPRVLAVFPAVGLAAGVYGIVLAVEREAPPGGIWLTLGLAVFLGLPAILAVRRAGGHAGSAGGSKPESRASASGALTGSDDLGAVAGALLAQSEDVAGIELACLVLVEAETRMGTGVVGRVNGRNLDWFADVRIDLENEPSGVATAAFEAVPFAVYDAAASKIVSRRLVEATGAKSVAFIPVLLDERVIAVLVAGSVAAHRAFTTEELGVLQRIAGDAALALDRARSTASLAEALARERFVARISARVRSELDIDELLRVAVEETGRALEVDRCLIRLGPHGDIPTAQWQETGLAPVKAGRRLAVSNLAVKRRQTVAIEDIGTAQELDDASLGGRDTLLSLGSRAVLAVPIVIFDELIGVLALHRTTPGRWGDDEVALTEAVAREIGLAVRVAQLLRENEQRMTQQGSLFRIAAHLTESLSLSDTLEALAQAANDALGGAFSAVLMPRGGTLELTASVGLPPILAAALEDRLPESAACLQAAAQEGRPLASPDITRDDRFEQPWREQAEASGYRALLAVPAASPRAEVGGLVVVFFAEEREFTDEDLELARHLGDAARGALERSELFEAERTARALSQQLARTGGVLATELDPAAVLEEVVQQAPALLGADACAVRTLEDDELVVSAASGEGAEEAVGSRTSATARLSGDVFQSRSPLAVEDVTTDERLVGADAFLLAGHAAFLGVPLSGPEGTLAGVLSVYARKPRQWRPEEVEALLALAGNTSAALANAELYSRVSLEKERSVAILANIADGIVAVDRDGQVVLWNSAAEEISGVPQEEAIGRTTVQVLQRQLESAEAETPSGQRLISIMRGGEEVWLSLSEAVMRDPLGAVAGRIFAFRDISADRMVEQVKSDFVAAVSHELRTPLTSIYGFAETLLRQDIPFGEEERRTFLGYIASESERLTEIVDQLLNVARLDAGDLQVELGRIDVGSVVSELVETVEESGVMNGHRFEIDLPDEPLAAEADPDKVRQVFNILVENALRYSPGGGTVTVGARRSDARVEVRVADEGIGIPAAERARIFRKFYRAESAARDGAAGTGLGLFIARELVTAMGGRIWVESTEGEGSSFSFELPAARE